MKRHQHGSRATDNLTGFQDQRPFRAKAQSLNAFAETEPVAGVTSYLLRHAKITRGQSANKTVGRKNASQNPTYFSAYTMTIEPIKAPTLIIK